MPLGNFPSRVDTAALAREIVRVPLERIKDGSGSDHGSGTTGWITGLSMARLSPQDYGANLSAALDSAVDWLTTKGYAGARVTQVMVNRLDSGHNLMPHMDAGPDHMRFHLPVITHSDVSWWDENNGRVHMSPGRWYGPVPYCGRLHAMYNASPVNRIHVVADFTR